ncbi:pimeloyl-ACP methyl ester carboxylesterase [Saccharothrix variisporea]|uniref:Pimeloyl-ACP methyl ester carboxylesterase n=1 Tax=Saccharothrix variisporea TaxID=543527 RepID=A0A495XPI1_9PSEU|nr:pimeloyl-ACP methyl ester carboxylesterase [Saccharothrix variisporea]
MVRERAVAGLPVRAVEVGGTTTSVVELGSGDPLVLLHGGIECGGVTWAPVVRGLATTHRVVVPDVPGLGESAPVENLDAGSLGRWLVRLMAVTGLDHPVLVVHSLVGSLAVRAVAAGVGPAVRQLVVCAVPAVGPYRMPVKLRYLAVRFAIRPTAANAERFDRFAFLDRDAVRARDPEWYDAWAAYTQERAGTPHVKRTMSKLIGSATRRIPDVELAALSAPTALLWGRDDRMVPLSVGETAARNQGWPLHVIDDSAHAPHLEQPERFIQALRDVMSPAG